MPKQHSSRGIERKHRSVNETRIAQSKKTSVVRVGMFEFDDPKDIPRFYSAKGKLAMWEKKANGETMHLAPLGYRNVRRDGRSTIERDPKVYPLVQEAKELRRQGWSIRMICEHMEKRGLRSKCGSVIGLGALHRVVVD